MPERDLPRSVGKILQKVGGTASALVATREPVRIISHYDADGLCAGGIPVSYTHLTLPTILLV